MIIVFPTKFVHETLPGNDCLDIHYTSVSSSAWEVDSKEWPEWVAVEPYIAPVSNAFLVDGTQAGVPLELHEHACVCTEGKALHKFRTSTGGVWDYEWSVGAHNVENGYGYKPALGFRREFSGVFTMCCVGSKENRDWSKKHTFQVLTESAVLPKGASFIHTALGAVTVDGVRYGPRSTASNLAPNTAVTVDPGSSIIVCVSEN